MRNGGLTAVKEEWRATAVKEELFCDAVDVRAADPRKQQTDPRVKRPRLGDPRVANAATAGQGGVDLSAQIQNTLQRLRPGRDLAGSTAGVTDASSVIAALPIVVPDGAELGSRLMDSLRGLMPAGELAAALQSSQVGQELHRVIHGGPVPAPTASSQAAVAPLMRVKVESRVKVENFVPVKEERSRVKVEKVRRIQPPPQPADPPSDDDDGVPHRLPPGFGAIPEDVVEERARMREELRQRAIKSTQPCKFGRTCKRRDCPNLHQEGREIDNELNVCAFGRRCKRKNCFYDHVDGREIDTDATKAMCKHGDKCRRPDCLYDHPATRDAILGPDFRICYFCHDSGHIAQDCARNPDSWAFKPDAKDPNQKAVLPPPTFKALPAPA